MKAFVIGLVIALTVVLIGLGHWSFVSSVLGIVVLVCWGLGGILSGAFLSGDRIRANNFAENDDDRRIRVNWSITLFLTGLPSVITLLVVFKLTS